MLPHDSYPQVLSTTLCNPVPSTPQLSAATSPTCYNLYSISCHLIKDVSIDDSTFVRFTGALSIHKCELQRRSNLRRHPMLRRQRKIHAHKVILKGASGVFNRAFNSQFPVALKTEYLIEGYPNAVVYAMLKHIYASPLEAPPGMTSVEDQIDYLFGIFAIANEYEIPSLGETSTQRIGQIMKTCRIDASTFSSNTSHISNRDRILQERKRFGSIVAKTAHLYINHDIADHSLMTGVIEACFELTPGLVWLEDNINICSLVESLDPFSGRLLKKAIAVMRFCPAITPLSSLSLPFSTTF